MAGIFVHHFNIALLLRLGDLDIRGLATKNNELLVDDYFNKLEQFVEQGSDVLHGLSEIVNLSANEEIFESLTGTKNLLLDIAYPKLSSYFDDMLDAQKKQDNALAAYYAKKVLDDFRLLHQRTKTAHNKDKIKDDVTVEGCTTVSLKKLLELMDSDQENRKLRILAVDDTAFMLKTINSILGKDYEVFSLTKGTLVEKFLVNTTPDLFLLDVTMPDISGYDLIPIIRRFEEHKDTPIIFLTARSSSEHVTTAVSLGASDYVVKPVSPDVLLEKVAKKIVRKRSF